MIGETGQSAFGDQITHENGQTMWRGTLVRRAFSKNDPFYINLGKPAEALKACLTDEMTSRLKDKVFTVKSDWLDKPRKDGTTHRHHFNPEENGPRALPSTQSLVSAISRALSSLILPHPA